MHLRNIAARIFGLVAALLAGPVLAAVPPCPDPSIHCFDLTAIGSSATINGAIFRVPATETSGTGLVDSFVRMQAGPSEQGYNTSDRPIQFGEVKTDLNFTHDLQLSNLLTNVVTIGGTQYIEFVLDTAEAGGPNQYLSLEELRVFISPTNLNTAFDPKTGTPPGPYDESTKKLGGLTATYDLDVPLQPGTTTDTLVKLSDPYPGNGKLDLIVLIPRAAFGVDNNAFVYLYSKFGREAPLDTDSSFEEWAHKLTGTFTPEPGAIALLIIGLAALGFAVRRGSTSVLPGAVAA